MKAIAVKGEVITIFMKGRIENLNISELDLVPGTSVNPIRRENYFKATHLIQRNRYVKTMVRKTGNSNISKINLKKPEK